MKSLYKQLRVEEAQAFESRLLQDDPIATAQAVAAAGTAIGEAIALDFLELRHWPANPTVTVLLGKGLNAADALVAVETLQGHLSGLRVSVVMTEDAAQLHPITRKSLDSLQQSLDANALSICSSEAWLARPFSGCDLLIDGVFGAGLRPPLPAHVVQLFERVKAAQTIAMKVAIDLPSGMTDSVADGTFVADFTYVPGLAKSAQFDLDHLPWLGRVRFLEVEPFCSQEPVGGTGNLVVAPSYYRRMNRWRPSASDKRDYGHAVILSGSTQMPGAAILSARAAVMAGCGLLTTLAPITIATRIASAIPESMWRPLPVGDDGGITTDALRVLANVAGKASALLIGPGMIFDRTTLFTVSRIVRETPLPLVLDASALVSDIITAILSRPKTSGKVILTPHRGEFRRLLAPSYTGTVEENLLAFTKRYQTVTILKGPQTVISDGERNYHVATGGPVLSRGGSGDVLAGMVLARFAVQPEEPLQAALEAVTWHGAAADVLARKEGQMAVQTSDLLLCLSPALRN